MTSRILLFLLLAIGTLSAPTKARADCVPISSHDLQSLAFHGRDRILAVDPEGALKTLNRALERVICLSEVPPQSMLSQTFMWQGVARSLLGDSPGALASFQQALTLQPELPWNEIFGKAGRREFEQARDVQAHAACACVRFPALPPGKQAFVDGRPVASRQRLALVSGRHLVQLVQGEIVVSTRMAEVSSSGLTFGALEVGAPAPSAGQRAALGLSLRAGPQLAGGLELRSAINLSPSWSLRLDAGLSRSWAGSATRALRGDVGLWLEHAWSLGRWEPWLGCGADYVGALEAGRLDAQTGLRFSASRAFAIEAGMEIGWAPRSSDGPVSIELLAGVRWRAFHASRR